MMCLNKNFGALLRSNARCLPELLLRLLYWNILLLFSAGEKDIPGLTDSTVPRRLGPKRASKIRKLFNLSKEDDVRQYVVRRPLTKEGECGLDKGFSKP